MRYFTCTKLTGRFLKDCLQRNSTNSSFSRQRLIDYQARPVTGACFHDCKVSVLLMRTAVQHTNFLYALMDKGYHKPHIKAYPI